MKKLAFEGATSFEMPKVNVVGLEKESNVVFATGVTVYKPNGSGGFSQSMLRAYAQKEEESMVDNGSLL